MHSIYFRDRPMGLTFTGKGAERAALATARDLGGSRGGFSVVPGS
jgi:hypothetical protein